MPRRHRRAPDEQNARGAGAGRRLSVRLELEADGDAAVYYVDSYDLSDDGERARYESYADDDSRRAAFREDALAELRAAAEAGSEAADWEMAVRNASVRTYETEGYGRVELRADWESLAYADERRVIVAQPFRGDPDAAGYEPDRRVAVHGPDGYRRNRTAPNPGRARANSVLVNPDTTDFSGFFVEFVDPDAPTATASPTPTDDGDVGDGGPGSDDGTGGDIAVVLRALVIAVVPAALVVLAVRRR
ncbi:hypothetical protein BRD02_06685 [Halobacteriales archaeon QS_8_69_73]|nr:MAG: hypothetical protein BRD02_06685 [Halobacteriales archaeon QS_8_69_73]